MWVANENQLDYGQGVCPEEAITIMRTECGKEEPGSIMRATGNYHEEKFRYLPTSKQNQLIFGVALARLPGMCGWACL